MEIRITRANREIYIFCGMSTMIIADEVRIRNYPKAISLTAKAGNRTVAKIHAITQVKADKGLETEESGIETIYRIGHNGRNGRTDYEICGESQ